MTRTWQSKIEGDLLDFVRPVFPQASIVAVNVNLLLADIVEVETDPGKPVSGDTFIESDETSTPVRSASAACGLLQQQPGRRRERPGGDSGPPARPARDPGVGDRRPRFPYSTTTTDRARELPGEGRRLAVIQPSRTWSGRSGTALGEDAEIDARRDLGPGGRDRERSTSGSSAPSSTAPASATAAWANVNVAVLPYADWISPEELAATPGNGHGRDGDRVSRRPASGDMGAASRTPASSGSPSSRSP